MSSILTSPSKARPGARSAGWTMTRIAVPGYGITVALAALGIDVVRPTLDGIHALLVAAGWAA